MVLINFFYEKKEKLPFNKGGVRLGLKDVVKESNIIGDIVYKGNRKIKDSKFKEELELVIGQRIKPSLIHEKKLKIKKLYAEKGYLNVDINKISSEGCSTSYIPLKNRDKFWNQSKDIINIKKAVNFDKLAKYYIWLIDNDISIFFERDCAIKILMLKKLKLTQINKEDKDIKDSNDNTKNDTKENIEIDKIDKIDKIEEKYESSDDEDELLYQMFNINY